MVEVGRNEEVKQVEEPGKAINFIVHDHENGKFGGHFIDMVNL